MKPLTVSIVIPTYGRESVLVATLQSLLNLAERADEILVVDQTETHEHSTEDVLNTMSDKGQIRWIRLARPSIPGAMNRGLLEGWGDIALFLDDDIIPGEDLVGAHRRAHTGRTNALIAGQVLQPGEEPCDVDAGADFRFCATKPQPVSEFPGGNFSLARRRALHVGGFDEQFVRVAYRFEREFADRFLDTGGEILFEPAASIRHLRAPSGGTRAFGNHLKTAMPGHAVGAYYYLLVSHRARARVSTALRTLWRGVATRFHLRNPWWIPISLWAQVAGMAWALLLRAQGPRLLDTKEDLQ